MLVYHFLNAQYGLESIQHRRLKVSYADNLNDPFEHRAIELSDKSLRRALEIALPALAKDYGLICFSEAYSSPMIWSHYADRHRGMCLGFEMPTRLLTRVKYVPKRLRNKITTRRVSQAHETELALKVASYKYSEWAYEREWRAFISLAETFQHGSFNFVSYTDDMALKKVIVGACSNVDRKQISDALGELAVSVETFKVRPAFQSFKMVRNRQDQLWK